MRKKRTVEGLTTFGVNRKLQVQTLALLGFGCGNVAHGFSGG
jgi:hypothetical protein